MDYKGLNIMMFIILFLAGCMSQQNQGGPSLEEPTPISDSEIEQSNEHSNQQAAKRLSQLASDVPNVQDATAVVFGSYTIVGVDVDGDLDRSRVGTIKYSVAEAIKHDPFGHYAFVIADADITDRLRKMNERIRQGHADEAILDEISNLVARFIPETPPKETAPNPNNRPNEDNQEQGPVENIRNDQSKEETE
ncbi:hypothetical protein CEY16_01685 [Halalkalibacillus sediminis]|uniref:YhcN/YlaJ family sporulation lipoprotein n=1 Tax=Halalkalibacillus sediminis TaxID=2018042 RepID=A0A2I0QW01_9BACI|nr:YhcN/YlaJ family sporulation lipoprotein [Halalkalibacillus sediminis]PKR78494.1 hypothetical protein CEY16_01685 [Halalkalibacillus sediminis]